MLKSIIHILLKNTEKAAAAMYLGEIPKTDKITISFDLGERHFEFSTGLLNYVVSDPHITFAEVIMVKNTKLRIDERCKNVCIKFANYRSGRVHLWENVDIQFIRFPNPRYNISSPDDSKQYNRRGAIRVPINRRAKCRISNVEGIHHCTILDVSITGIGINVDIGIAERQLRKRIIETAFVDEITGKAFHIKARCVHATVIFNNNVRCGCRIVEVRPSINEYINQKQLQGFAKAARHKKKSTR